MTIEAFCSILDDMQVGRIFDTTLATARLRYRHARRT